MGFFQDVFGAAETGSGKTLAFGLPILQRLLEEREKDEKMISETGEAHERIVSRGYLRALIITPTRELAKQVPVYTFLLFLIGLCVMAVCHICFNEVNVTFSYDKLLSSFMMVVQRMY